MMPKQNIPDVVSATSGGFCQGKGGVDLNGCGLSLFATGLPSGAKGERAREREGEGAYTTGWRTEVWRETQKTKKRQCSGGRGGEVCQKSRHDNGGRAIGFRIRGTSKGCGVNVFMHRVAERVDKRVASLGSYR